MQGPVQEKKKVHMQVQEQVQREQRDDHQQQRAESIQTMNETCAESASASGLHAIPLQPNISSLDPLAPNQPSSSRVRRSLTRQTTPTRKQAASGIHKIQQSASSPDQTDGSADNLSGTF